MAQKKIGQKPTSLWHIFLQKRGKNGLLAGCMLFFNTLAALLEGVSFALLLAGFAALTGESTALNLPITEHLFLFSLLGAVVSQVCKSFFAYLGYLMMTLLTLEIQKGAQKEVFKRIFKMSFEEILHFKKGELMHKAISPPHYLPLIFDEYNRLVISLLLLAVYLISMAKLSFSLTTILMLLFACAAGLQKYFFRKIMKASSQHADHLSTLSKEASQNLEGLKVVHLFHRQTYTLHKMESLVDKTAKPTLQLKSWSALIPTLNESIGILLVGLTLLLGSFFLLPSPATLFIYLTLTYRFATRLQQMMSAKGVIAYYSGPRKQLEELLAKQLEPQEAEEALPVPFVNALTFEQVSFTYPHAPTEALKNITLTIPKNKIIALVGISGAGKSSLIDLLLRLYRPTQGEICIDNQPISSFSLKSWRELFAVVPQDPFLFDATIEENIRFGNLNASETEVVEAAKMAGAHSFIEGLSHKYQTLIGERGLRLSGGEKQRISLAQALVKNPEILVLDEATSHLDSYSEQLVQETLHHLRFQKTLLIVAHRLATIHMADLIYVLENGRLIESGTHKDLLNLGGRYQLFWHLQTASH